MRYSAEGVRVYIREWEEDSWEDADGPVCVGWGAMVSYMVSLVYHGSMVDRENWWDWMYDTVLEAVLSCKLSPGECWEMEIRQEKIRERGKWVRGVFSVTFTTQAKRDSREVSRDYNATYRY